MEKNLRRLYWQQNTNPSELFKIVNEPRYYVKKSFIELRKTCGISMNDFAKACELSAREYRRFERGIDSVNEEDMEKMRKVLVKKLDLFFKKLTRGLEL